MKNITFRADENLIKEARIMAAREQTSLNAKFCSWLENYVQGQKRTEDALELISDLRSRYSTSGHNFTRDEMNDR